MNYPEVLLHIDGKWRASNSSHELPVVNPATEEIIGNVAHADQTDLDEAVASSSRAFKTWRSLSAYERSSIMRRAAGLIRERVDFISTLMTMEQGKVLAESKRKRSRQQTSSIGLRRNRGALSVASYPLAHPT